MIASGNEATEHTTKIDRDEKDQAIKSYEVRGCQIGAGGERGSATHPRLLETSKKKSRGIWGVNALQGLFSTAPEGNAQG